MPGTKSLQAQIDDRKRIAFQQEHPEWHFQAIGYGAYEASRWIDGVPSSVHLQGASLGEAVAKAESFVLRCEGDTRTHPHGCGSS
jgi:hypothetical protein